MNTKYAMITGAGDGLGRSFAMNLASKGYNLILISLPGSKLERLAIHLENHFKITVDFLECNLCAPDGIDRVMDFLQANNLKVNILINNAGMGHTQRFDELTTQYITEELSLNIHVLTQLSSRLIPLMKQCTPAHIINISSMACFYTLPYKNTYAASKAYVKQFSLSLRAELEPDNISVSVVCPSGINSNAQKYFIFRHSSWFTRQCFMHPDDVAEYAIARSFAGDALIIPGWINRLIHLFADWFPEVLKKFLSRKFIKPIQPSEAKAEVSKAA
jgi:uncharacterized protein